MATKKPPAPPKVPATQSASTSAPIPSATGRPSWTDHPVYVLGGVAFATSAAVAAVFYQVVLPAREAEAKSKVDKLEAEQAQLQSKLAARDSELGALRNDLQASKDLAKGLYLELRSSPTAQFFSPKDPYPNGLRSVRAENLLQTSGPALQAGIELANGRIAHLEI